MNREEIAKEIDGVFYAFREALSKNTNIFYNKYNDETLEKGRSLTDYIADWHIAEIEKAKREAVIETMNEFIGIYQKEAKICDEIIKNSIFEQCRKELAQTGILHNIIKRCIEKKQQTKEQENGY